MEVSLTVPAGWTVKPAKLSTPSGSFIVEGVPDKLKNALILTAGKNVAEISIPAPWLIGTSAGHPQAWSGADFQPTKAILSADDSLSQGKGWRTPIEMVPGKPLVWAWYFAERAYGGEGKPGAVDFAAMVYVDRHLVGYGARWIFCDDPRTINACILPLGYTRDNQVRLWLNGRELSAGNLKNGSSPRVAVLLKKGWNALVFKSNHREGQWQFDVELTAEKDESLDGVRFQASPPENFD